MGYVTSEKLAPSPITMCADINQAIAVERRNGGGKLPLKDALAKVIAQYNKMVTIKRHRIESGRRALIYNLCPGLMFSLSCVFILCRGLFCILGCFKKY